MNRLPPLVLALLAVSAACTTIQAPPATSPPPTNGPFSHEAFSLALRRFVDEQGRVDYRLLAETGQAPPTAMHGNSPEDELVEADAALDRYFALLCVYSPDSHPGLFPSEADRLAYWINAYNAAVIEAVLQYWPIDSVLDVKKPWYVFFLSGKSGFFYFQRMVFGGETMSLYQLENDVIRERFDEPRVHFALNCASLGCPRLPRRAFTGASLDEQLGREARAFMAEERNLRVDHQQSAVYLSEIFDWYEDDFTGWHERQYGRADATLLDYVKLYAPPELADDLERAAGYEVRFTPYDWRLNQQDGTPPPDQQGGKPNAGGGARSRPGAAAWR